MADTLVQRVTGQATAAAVPVEVNLVMTDRALFTLPDPPDRPDAEHGRGADESEPGAGRRADQPAGADEPAELIGYGPIPAALARRLIRRRRHEGVGAPALHPPG
jgi:hypothetical protein